MPFTLWAMATGRVWYVFHWVVSENILFAKFDLGSISRRIIIWLLIMYVSNCLLIFAIPQITSDVPLSWTFTSSRYRFGFIVLQPQMLSVTITICVCINMFSRQWRRIVPVFSALSPVKNWPRHSIITPLLLQTRKCLFVCLYTFFSAILKLIWMPFGTKWLFAPGEVLKYFW